MKKIALLLLCSLLLPLTSLAATLSESDQRKFNSAISAHDLETLTSLLEKGGSANQLLHMSVSELNSDMLQLALNNGADNNSKNQNGDTPLHTLSAIVLEEAQTLRSAYNLPEVAVSEQIEQRTKRLEMLDMLVSGGANINVLSDSGETPISTAFEANQPMIVDYFIAKKVDASIGPNLFQKSSVHKIDTAYLKYLLEYGYRATADEGDKTTPLHRLVQHTANKDKIALLLEYGAKINDTDENGNTALTASAASETVDGDRLFSVLVNLGANVPAGYTQDKLSKAILTRDHVKVLKLIQASPESVNAINSDGTTPLILASKGSLKLVRILLDHSADLNARVNERNALDEAIVNGQDYIAHYLLKQGIDVNLYKSKSKTEALYSPALSAAVYSGNHGLVQLLLEKGAALRHDGTAETHPLVLATESGNLDVIKLLVEKGMDTKVNAGDGSLARIAEAAGYSNIVQYYSSQNIK